MQECAVEVQRASRGRARMMVSVVMSSVTRVLATSLDLSTFARQPTTYRGPLLALTMTVPCRAGVFNDAGIFCSVVSMGPMQYDTGQHRDVVSLETVRTEH